MINFVEIFIRGFVMGISIAAPVGPIGLLCIRRTLAEGKWSGFLSGMGAASADMVYGAIAAFGLTLVTDALIEHTFWLRLIGGCFLLYLGVKTLLSRPAEQTAQSNRSGLFGAYLSTFLLTLSNPMTILSFAAIFAGTSFAGQTNSPIILVAGVFSGSAFWWLLLSLGVGSMRERLTINHMAWVNRVSGAVITAFGLYALFGV